MLHLARKAFHLGKPPFPLLHIDSTWEFREMYEFRDRHHRWDPKNQRPELWNLYNEMLLATTSERQGRAIDHDQAGSMEDKKKEGYF